VTALMRDMGDTRIEVARAAPDRLSALAPVFGRAFVYEPMMHWPMGEHGDVVDRFTRCFGYFLEEVLALGIVWEAGDAKGAAVWVPPDRSEAWEDHPWNQPRISALTGDRGRRYDAFWDWVDSRSPNEMLRRGIARGRCSSSTTCWERRTCRCRSRWRRSAARTPSMRSRRAAAGGR
jgi:hypothetical protein